MSIRVAINGYGRIGRCVLRSIYEYKRREFEVVAINDLSGSINSTAHFTKYDSTHGKFCEEIMLEDNKLFIAGKGITITSIREPERLPWQELGIDLVFECTGKFVHKEEAKKHIYAGAKKVLISAPGYGVDATIVYGVNHDILKDSDEIVSNASCTTNCLAPLLKPLHKVLEISYGLLNTVHAYTKDQVLLDANHSDLRRARSATQSIIPTKTGATKALGLVMPELAGKLDGFAVRVPTLNVSMIDLTFSTSCKTSVAEVNEIMASAKSDILHINYEPLVSCDFNHSPASAIFDATQTQSLGNLVKIIAWYDNEWGFSNRMLDTAACMMNF